MNFSWASQPRYHQSGLAWLARLSNVIVNLKLTIYINGGLALLTEPCNDPGVTYCSSLFVKFIASVGFPINIRCCSHDAGFAGHNIKLSPIKAKQKSIPYKHTSFNWCCDHVNPALPEWGLNISSKWKLYFSYCSSISH